MVCGAEETFIGSFPASRSASADRRTSITVRVLLQRHDHQSFRAAVEKLAAERIANSVCNERPFVQVRHVSASDKGDPTGFSRDERSCEMSTRRDFLKTGGALVVGFSLGDAAFSQDQAA